MATVRTVDKQQRRRMDQQIGHLSDTEVVKRWRADLEELSNEITTVFLNRTVFKALHESLVAAGGGNIVGDYLVRTYHQAQAVAIRRLADRDHRARSLRTVLAEMRERCSAVTRADFTEHAPTSNAVDPAQAADIERLDRIAASEDFDRLAGAGATHMPASIPQEALHDLDRLDNIKQLVDTRIAHADREPAAPVIAADLDQAIDELESHLNNLTRILSAPEHRPSQLSIIDDWFTPFIGDDRAQKSTY